MALIFSSCLKEVDMEVEQIPHLLVVNCFFTEGEAFKVNVSRLASYPDLTDRSIADARVVISTGENDTAALTYTANGSYSNPAVIPEPGKVYRITVDVDGYPQATAQDSLPRPVFVDSVTYTARAGKYDDGIDFNRYSVWFRDIPGRTWYSVQILKGDTVENKLEYWAIDIFSTDPVISAEGITGEDYNSWFVFSDTLISNRVYCLKIDAGSDYDTEKARVLLVSGTYPYYQYLKRLIRNDSYSWEDPFKPYNPVPLYSNIKNGLGVFAGFRCKPFNLEISNTDDGE